MSRNSELAEAATQWWTDQISSLNISNFKNGVKGELGETMTTLATMLAIQDAPSEAQVLIFKALLYEKIENQLDKDGCIGFYCDYAPDNILGEIAKRAGISGNVFPWKTMMSIDSERGITITKNGKSKRILK